MARVVLVWNEHPTEVVAGHHARAVAKILRERYAHEVIVEKIPAKETNYGIVQRLEPSDAVKALGRLKPSIVIAKYFARKHNAHAFNFHSSEAETMGRARERQPEEFTVGEHRHGHYFYSPFEVYLEGRRNGNYFVVEVPDLSMNIPDRMWEKRAKKRESVLRATGEKARGATRVMANIAKGYHIWHSPLGDPAQHKYKAQAISEKIAAAIHARLQTETARRKK